MDYAESSYEEGNKRFVQGERCFFSIFIPYENYYKEPYCCITFRDIMFSFLKIVLLGLLFYVVYSGLEYRFKGKNS